jgi:hypothetical protein
LLVQRQVLGYKVLLFFENWLKFFFTSSKIKEGTAGRQKFFPFSFVAFVGSGMDKNQDPG